MTKQECIQQAYGELHSILADNMNENGFVSVEMINSHDNNGMDYETFGYDYKEVETVLGQPGNYLWRPISLKGLETNNGWTKTEEKGTPETSGTYMCISEEWDHEVKMFFNGSSFLRDGWVQEPTHWRVIVDFPKPLY